MEEKFEVRATIVQEGLHWLRAVSCVSSSVFCPHLPYQSTRSTCRRGRRGHLRSRLCREGRAPSSTAIDGACNLSGRGGELTSFSFKGQVRCTFANSARDYCEGVYKLCSGSRTTSETAQSRQTKWIDADSAASESTAMRSRTTAASPASRAFASQVRRALPVGKWPQNSA